MTALRPEPAPIDPPRRARGLIPRKPHPVPSIRIQIEDDLRIKRILISHEPLTAGAGTPIITPPQFLSALGAFLEEANAEPESFVLIGDSALLVLGLISRTTRDADIMAGWICEKASSILARCRMPCAPPRCAWRGNTTLRKTGSTPDPPTNCSPDCPRGISGTPHTANLRPPAHDIPPRPLRPHSPQALRRRRSGWNRAARLRSRRTRAHRSRIARRRPLGARPG